MCPTSSHHGGKITPFSIIVDTWGLTIRDMAHNSRRAGNVGYTDIPPPVNAFFQRFYRRSAAALGYSGRRPRTLLLQAFLVDVPRRATEGTVQRRQ
jgi:hypothetical protein